MNDFRAMDSYRDELGEEARRARLSIDRLQREVRNYQRLLFLAIEATGGRVVIPSRGFENPLGPECELRRRDLPSGNGVVFEARRGSG